MLEKFNNFLKTNFYRVLVGILLVVAIAFGIMLNSGMFNSVPVVAESISISGHGITYDNGVYYVTAYNDVSFKVDSFPSNVTDKTVQISAKNSGFTVTEKTSLGSSAVISINKDEFGVPTQRYGYDDVNENGVINISCGNTYAKLVLAIDAPITKVSAGVTREGGINEELNKTNGNFNISKASLLDINNNQYYINVAAQFGTGVDVANLQEGGRTTSVTLATEEASFVISEYNKILIEDLTPLGVYEVHITQQVFAANTEQVVTDVIYINLIA